MLQRSKKIIGDVWLSGSMPRYEKHLNSRLWDTVAKMNTKHKRKMKNQGKFRFQEENDYAKTQSHFLLWNTVILLQQKNCNIEQKVHYIDQ